MVKVKDNRDIINLFLMYLIEFICLIINRVIKCGKYICRKEEIFRKLVKLFLFMNSYVFF